MNRRNVNMITGIVGAVIGVLIGVAAYVGIYQLGYIAGIAAIIMMVCAIKGFELLGGGLNIPAVIICIIMVLAAIWFSTRAAYAVQLVREVEGYSFSTAWKQIPYLIESSEELKEAWWQDLLWGYGLSLLAIIPSIRDFVKGARGGAEPDEE